MGQSHKDVKTSYANLAQSKAGAANTGNQLYNQGVNAQALFGYHSLAAGLANSSNTGRSMGTRITWYEVSKEKFWLGYRIGKFAGYENSSLRLPEADSAEWYFTKRKAVARIVALRLLGETVRLRGSIDV
jgi:hypothetical protein